MALNRTELEIWVKAVNLYDDHKFDQALEAFSTIAYKADMHFNCGIIHSIQFEYKSAVKCFQTAVSHNPWLAIAYFQCGVANWFLKEFEEAIVNFNDTIKCLRGNDYIDYTQLGLSYKLHVCEVLFNRGLCYIYLQQEEYGLKELKLASTKKAQPDHDVIDEAIAHDGQLFGPFSVKLGHIYRPSAAKVNNLHRKDYLGKARLIAAQDERYQRPHPHRRNQSAAQVPRVGNLSQSPATATNLAGRTRQQSEPPLQRTAYSPTLPAEVIRRPTSRNSRRDSGSGTSTRSAEDKQISRPRPKMLELGAAAFSPHSVRHQPENPRPGTVRSMSEQPRTRRDGPSSRQGQNDGREGRRRRSLRVDTRDDTYVLKPSVYESSNRDVSHTSLISTHSSQARGISVTDASPKAYTQRSRSTARQNVQRPNSIEEEDAQPASAHPDSAVSGIPLTSKAAAAPATNGKSHRGLISGYEDGPLPYEIVAANGYLHSTRERPYEGAQRAVELSKIRVKVRGERDTRYIMLMPPFTFSSLTEQISKKFGLLCEAEKEVIDFKIKVRDEEGDMVTLGDQEDLDMVLQGVRDGLSELGSPGGNGSGAAGRGGGGTGGGAVMGKMEVWVHEV